MKVLTYIDWAMLLVSGVVAIALSVLKTPVAFWLPAWFIQGAVLVYALARKDGVHWPSTSFGVVAVAHVITLIVLLAVSGMSLDGLAQLFFGLLFIHGLLYLVAAKRFLIRRGWLKPKNA
jgi:hypothetical protein